MFEWLRRLRSALHRWYRSIPPEEPEAVLIGTTAPPCPIRYTPPRVRIPPGPPSLEEAARKEWLPTPETKRRKLPRRRPRRTPGSQASRQNIGKFMKHGRQSSYYRASVKAKIRPEEEDD